MVVNELIKNRNNTGQVNQLYFWRDNSGTEVDIVLERGNELAGIEIKSGITVSADSMRSLNLWRQYALASGRFSGVFTGLVYAGDIRFKRDSVDVLPWSNL